VAAARAWNALPSSVRSAPSTAAVPWRPEDGTVPVIVLLTIVFSRVDTVASLRGTRGDGPPG